MGLQYVDGTGTERTLTVEDMKTPDFQQAYSDLYKGLNGIRPRWSVTPEEMLHFFDTYEAAFEESEEEDRRALQARSERDGIHYTSWSHFYDLKEKREYEEYLAEEAKRKEEDAAYAEFNRRGSAMPTIEAWLHGDIM